MRERYDVVVIGGGAAGLSGALALARFRRSVLVVDAGQPRNAPAGHMHNYLGREGTPPAELLATGRAEVAAYGAEIVSGTVVSARVDGPIAAPEGGFIVELADGREVRARRLLVTTGLVDELPAIPGVAERWGRDVLHCPYCHGWEARDRAIGIIGGPMAMHAALLWSQLSADVVLFLHTAPPLTEEQAAQLAALGVRVIADEVAVLEIDDDRLTGVRLRSGEIIPRDVVVVAPRFVARAEVLRGLGVDIAEWEHAGHTLGTYVPADASGATAVPGVWVAGNITEPSAQVIASAAAGLRAGAMINAELAAADAASAVAARAAERAVAA